MGYRADRKDNRRNTVKVMVRAGGGGDFSGADRRPVPPTEAWLRVLSEGVSRPMPQGGQQGDMGFAINAKLRRSEVCRRAASRRLLEIFKSVGL